MTLKLGLTILLDDDKNNLTDCEQISRGPNAIAI